MNQVNYQKELEKVLKQHEGAQTLPTLFLHSCCAPCSSYVLEYLAPYFRITVFYYNPNISALAEYQHRVSEQKRLIGSYNSEKKGHPIEVLEGDYRPSDFYEAVRGYEDCREGGERCFRCYELRLRETALQAAKRGMEYFATTLTISPLKNAAKLNEIGRSLQEELAEGKAERAGRKAELVGKKADLPGRKAERAGIETSPLWLPSDFKKRGGYQRSVELSAQYGLYRQNYCGCGFSRAQSEKEQKEYIE